MALFVRSDLRAKARINRIFESAGYVLKSDAEKWAAGKTYDIFLSHCSLDAPELVGLKLEIEETGFSVYVDWEDPQLNRADVSARTAQELRARMKDCSCLFCAISPNAEASRWMPWELGYFDGLKGKVAILPVLDQQPGVRDRFQGQEYFGLYPYVATGTVKESGESALWIHEDETTYVVLPAWLKGDPPRRH